MLPQNYIEYIGCSSCITVILKLDELETKGHVSISYNHHYLEMRESFEELWEIRNLTKQCWNCIKSYLCYPCCAQSAEAMVIHNTQSAHWLSVNTAVILNHLFQTHIKFRYFVHFLPWCECHNIIDDNSTSVQAMAKRTLLNIRK